MEALYDVQAPKKATNLSVNSDLLNRARSLNINLSSTFEAALNEALARSH
jgi:antitoxin CcdA